MRNLIFAILLLSFNLKSKGQIYTPIGECKFDARSEQPKTQVYKEDRSGLVFFKADFDLDLDGHPQAYHPNNTGLLHNANGSNSQGVMSRNVVLYIDNTPYIQKETDPAPGYYLSLTTLHLKKYPVKDTRRYVNPDSVSYFVLPDSKFAGQGIKVGDIALVHNQKNKKYTFAIYADSGPGTIIGEGSTLLAKKLGIPVQIKPSTGRIVGGLDTGDVLYLVFPGSGKGPNGYSTLNDKEVTELGKKAITAFGTEEQLIRRILEFYNN